MVAGAFATVGAATSADAPTDEVPTARQLTDLTAAQIAMLNSSQPIVVTMDPSNGDIVNVTSNDPPATGP